MTYAKGLPGVAHKGRAGWGGWDWDICATPTSELKLHHESFFVMTDMAYLLLSMF